MIRQHLVRDLEQGERHFRWRGGEVSRIEALADAIFGLALALIVLSAEIPWDFAGLEHMLVQIPVFAVCFALIVSLWVHHYYFHRRYGLEDPVTLTLSLVYLFLVLVYVYPLHFLFTFLWEALRHGRWGYVERPDGGLVPIMHEVDDGRWMLVYYGLGFVLLFGLHALLVANAWRQRERLELDEVERYVTRRSIGGHLLSVAVGALSVGLALTMIHPGLTGMCYALLGPAHAYYGWRTGATVDRMLAARADAERPA